MKSIEYYKEKYGDENILVEENNKLIIPIWLFRYILNMTGLKSKKKRIIKKVIKKEVSLAILRGMNVSRRS